MPLVLFIIDGSLTDVLLLDSIIMLIFHLSWILKRTFVVTNEALIFIKYHLCSEPRSCFEAVHTIRLWSHGKPLRPSLTHCVFQCIPNNNSPKGKDTRLWHSDIQ